MIAALALLMFFQSTSTPKPVTVIEPVMQPVLHCPSGWHVEVWHQAAPIYGGETDSILQSDPDGYIPYSPPIVISFGIPDVDHPDKCVRDPADTPRTTGKGCGSDGDEPVVRSCTEGFHALDGKCIPNASRFSDAEIIGTGSNYLPRPSEIPVVQPPTVLPSITSGSNLTDAGQMLVWLDKDSHGCTTPFLWDDKVCRITITFTADASISCTFDPKTVSVTCTYKPKNQPKQDKP
jgi:hypothetical protein